MIDQHSQIPGEALKNLGFAFELDHIGVAVESLEAGAAFYQSLGLVPEGAQIEFEEVPSERVRVGFLRLGNRANIELLEATSEDSPICKFLAKRGPGIHHICFRVADLDAVMARLKEKKVRLLNDEPKLGAHDCRVAFIHPSSAGGVLVELSQKREPRGPAELGQKTGGGR
jgi:methylmalonyl-CoA/ethylmalonyl-CoA epimerase